MLKILDKDGCISKTSERIGKSVNDIISFLNEFYKFVFIYIKEVKIKYKFIPNEKCIYRKMEDIYINDGIDKDLRDI